MPRRAFRWVGVALCLALCLLPVVVPRAARPHVPAEPPASGTQRTELEAALLTARGQTGAAGRSLLEQIVARGRSPVFARAALELGHRARRVGDFEAALEAYSLVVLERGALARERDSALFWRGRVHYELQEWSAALRAWWFVLEHGSDAVQRVWAAEWLMRTQLDLDDDVQARRVYARVRELLHLELREQSAFGERLRSLLERSIAMRRLRAQRVHPHADSSSSRAPRTSFND